jgi:plasmid stabilization system protein ParE
MPQVRYAPGAIRDLQRLREFLRLKNPAAAQRAGETIVKAVQILGHQPQVGRPVEDMPDEYREWLIDFGDSGYVAKYRIDGDAVTILAVRHQKEAGY